MKGRVIKRPLTVTKNILSALRIHKLGPQRAPELVLLTGQIHHLTAFSCDLLTSCWLVFSSQWPIAISLVITLLKSSSELDNARELYMSPVSSAAKNRQPPMNKIWACLQCEAVMGEEQGCRCVSVSVCRYLQETECKCAEIMWYEGVWWLLELNRAGLCWFANKDSGSHLTPRSFTRVYVTLKMRGSFIQLHNDLKANESRSSSTTDLVVVCWQTSILLFVTHTLFAFMPFSTHSNRSVFNDRIKALSLSY